MTMVKISFNFSKMLLIIQISPNSLTLIIFIGLFDMLMSRIQKLGSYSLPILQELASTTSRTKLSNFILASIAIKSTLLAISNVWSKSIDRRRSFPRKL
jgi:hypothetical protein